MYSVKCCALVVLRQTITRVILNFWINFLRAKETGFVGTPPPDDMWRASLSGATPSGLPQEDTWRAPLFGLPQGKAHGTCEHHIQTVAYPYPDMLSRSLTKVSKPYYVIPTACHSLRSAACRAKRQEWWQVASHDLRQSSIGWWWPCHHLEASWRVKRSSHH